MTITRTEYAVRVKGTHRYLPRPQRRDGRGGSHLEPVDFADRSSWPPRYAKDMMIRSYTTKKAAKNLLTSWLQGKRTGGTCYGDWDNGDVVVKHQPHRRAEDMEIVKIEITLPSIEQRFDA